MKKRKSKHLPAGLGYILGLFFGLAIMTVFSIVIGLSFFGILLGLSFSLSIGIAFECVFTADKKLPLFQKILLSVSAILLVISVVSLIIVGQSY